MVRSYQGQPNSSRIPWHIPWRPEVVVEEVTGGREVAMVAMREAAASLAATMEHREEGLAVGRAVECLEAMDPVASTAVAVVPTEGAGEPAREGGAWHRHGRIGALGWCSRAVSRG